MRERLIALRRKGMANREIAETLGVKLGTLEQEISMLVAAGVIRSRRGLLWSRADSWVAGRERATSDVIADVERLYTHERSHSEIADLLDLTPSQVHNILTKLFAAGLAKRQRPTARQVQAIHAAYLAGGAIDELAEQMGYTGAGVRRRMRQMGLPVARRGV
jgi:DNA-binding MarR family transcriptional regulator